AAVGAALGLSHNWISLLGTSGPYSPPSDPQLSLSRAGIPFRECGPEDQYHWTTSRPCDEIDLSLRAGSPSAFGGINRAMSQRTIVASEEPEASSRPSGVKPSDRTVDWWPSSARRSFPVSGSQRRTTRSSCPVASEQPSGAQAMQTIEERFATS